MILKTFTLHSLSTLFKIYDVSSNKTTLNNYHDFKTVLNLYNNFIFKHCINRVIDCKLLKHGNTLFKSQVPDKLLK